jgi:hypothetical protein
MVLMNGKADLAQVVRALTASGCFTGRLDGRQE